MTAGTHITDRISALNRQRMGILRGPHGAILDENSVPPADREYLTQIRDQMPHLIMRSRGTRRAILILWIAIGLLALSVAAIAIAVTARSEAFAFLALALVIAGVAGVFAGVATAIVPLARSADPVVEVTKRTGVPG